MLPFGSFARCDVLAAGQSVESQSQALLQQLHTGEISVTDLMGPLHGIPKLNASIVLPKGSKDYFPTSGEAEFFPKDVHNLHLEENVHPRDYVNPDPEEVFDLGIIVDR
jgi:hypothetical protein